MSEVCLWQASKQLYSLQNPAAAAAELAAQCASQIGPQYNSELLQSSVRHELHGATQKVDQPYSAILVAQSRG